MPLETQIVRKGETLKLKWGGFHVAAMTLASVLDGPMTKTGCKLWADPLAVRAELVEKGYYQQDPTTHLRGRLVSTGAAMPITRPMVFQLMDYGAIGLTPLNSGAVTLKHRHVFIDAADGEVLVLLPGDTLKAWRAWSSAAL